ncbi:MAG: hypothetical protein M3R60_15485, partial [Pseudomonadota bacterium]|nr:hypothetical protein [Pseudomonadota bacterium]
FSTSKPANLRIEDDGETRGMPPRCSFDYAEWRSKILFRTAVRERGDPSFVAYRRNWIPACAGMTVHYLAVQLR